MTRCNALLAIVLFCMYTGTRADSCPSPEMIIKRDLSKQYEWTVDENTTLQDLLSVKELYAVRIMDHDDYVSCHYTTDKWPIKLDMSPSSGKCKPVPHSSKWKNTDSGQVVCMEKDIANCDFNFECKQEQ